MGLAHWFVPFRTEDHLPPYAEQLAPPGVGGEEVRYLAPRRWRDSNAAGVFSSASGKVCRYFWVVMIWE